MVSQEATSGTAVQSVAGASEPRDDRLFDTTVMTTAPILPLISPFSHRPPPPPPPPPLRVCYRTGRRKRGRVDRARSVNCRQRLSWHPELKVEGDVKLMRFEFCRTSGYHVCWRYAAKLLWQLSLIRDTTLAQSSGAV